MEGAGTGGDPVKAFVDRIEDGRTAVVIVEDFGELLIPAKRFGFKLHEGMHLELSFAPDPAGESRTLDAVKRLQARLLRRTRRRNA